MEMNGDDGWKLLESGGTPTKLTKDAINAPGHGLLADTAFPVKDDLRGRIMTPLKEGDLESVPDHMRPGLLRLSAAITSMRQAAEWGMDAIGKVYRILQRKLHWNKDIRKRRLTNIIKLYNFRVRTTGISQIKNYFDN